MNIQPIIRCFSADGQPLAPSVVAPVPQPGMSILIADRAYRIITCEKCPMPCRRGKERKGWVCVLKFERFPNRVEHSLWRYRFAIWRRIITNPAVGILAYHTNQLSE